MESYKSYIDGHEISCKPLPGEGCTRPEDSTVRALRRRDTQGSSNAQKLMPETKTVDVNGSVKVFLKEGFEYFCSGQSLIDYLFSIRDLSDIAVERMVIKIF